MNYLLRSIASLVLIFIIYQAVQVLRRQLKYENYQNFIVNDMDEVTKYNNETYKKLGIPSEWYKFDDVGYSYQDPEAWKGEQHQPVCYDKDDTHPAPIMSPGIDQYMFYKPKNGKKTNTEMVFESQPKAVWTRTVTKSDPKSDPIRDIINKSAIISFRDML